MLRARSIRRREAARPSPNANPLADARIAFVGAGVMAESMIAGLLKNALIPAEHIVASHPREDRRQRLEERFGILTTGSNRDAAHGADLVLLTIKPQVLQQRDAPAFRPLSSRSRSSSRSSPARRSMSCSAVSVTRRSCGSCRTRQPRSVRG